mgnify:CR=1 FL=1
MLTCANRYVFANQTHQGSPDKSHKYPTQWCIEIHFELRL